jgi:hypothetical protein
MGGLGHGGGQPPPMGWFGHPCYLLLLSFFFLFFFQIKKINILMYKKRCVLKNVTTVNKIEWKDFMIGVDVPMPLFVKKKT